ncbi:hypothetical protein GWK47_033846 [Chionoecetes opilio]|uniref:Uncharacterized protein n=1 Tax=Chionoecetes opilio TaxID=41210 RepID=A0A8J5CPD5_CHIOP|nr:hypothetical protein GWK47_033846 [Chionoecetes opilio]
MAALQRGGQEMLHSSCSVSWVEGLVLVFCLSWLHRCVQSQRQAAVQQPRRKLLGTTPRVTPKAASGGQREVYMCASCPPPHAAWPGVMGWACLRRPIAYTCMYRNAYAGAKKYKAGISPPVRRVSRQATGGSRGGVVTVSHLRHWSPCRARRGVGT